MPSSYTDFTRGSVNAGITRNALNAHIVLFTFSVSPKPRFFSISVNVGMGKISRYYSGYAAYSLLQKYLLVLVVYDLGFVCIFVFVYGCMLPNGYSAFVGTRQFQTVAGLERY